MCNVPIFSPGKEHEIAEQLARWQELRQLAGQMRTSNGNAKASAERLARIHGQDHHSKQGHESGRTG